jgi:hypothetical protein
LINIIYKTYLSFLLVEIVVAACKTLHGNKQVPQGALEIIPIAACVEELPHESFNLHLVEVREQGIDALDEDC